MVARAAMTVATGPYHRRGAPLAWTGTGRTMDNPAEFAADLFVILLIMAALVAVAASRLAIPYSVALVLAGLAVAAVAPRDVVTVTPDVLLFVLLPGLVFEAALKTDLGRLRVALGAIALLAAPGVLVTAIVVAAILNLATGLDPALAFLIGAMVAATDPAAVVAIFQKLPVPARLATVVEAESLFNDGTGIVLFAIAVSAIRTPIEPAGAIFAFVATIVVSTVIGIVAGLLATRIFASIDDHLIELTISLVAAYGTYLVADRIHESGIIATVVAGIVIGTYGRQLGMSQKTAQALDTVWEFLAFLLTALTFLLVGLAIQPQDLLLATPLIVWAFIAVTLARVVVVYGLLGGATRLLRRRDRLSRGSFHVLFWAGLRGAVATALALSLPADIPQRQLLAETVFGVVILTLVIQGTTTRFVIERAGVATVEAR